MKNRKRSVSSIIFVMVIVVSLLIPGLTVYASPPDRYKIAAPDLVSVGDDMFACDRDASNMLVKLYSSGDLRKVLQKIEITSEIIEHKGKLYYTVKYIGSRYLYLQCYDPENASRSDISDKITGNLMGVTDSGCIISSNGKFSLYSSNGTRTLMKGTAGMNFIAANNRYAFFSKLVSTTKQGGSYKKKINIYRYSTSDNKLAKIKYLTYTYPSDNNTIDLSGYVFDNNNIVFGLNFYADRFADVYFMNANGSNIKKLCERTGLVPNISNNCVYFSQENNRTVRVDQNGKVKTLTSKDGGVIIGQNTKSQYVVLRNNNTENAELYIYSSLSKAPIRSLIKLPANTVPGKVSNKKITVNGMSGDVVFITARIDTDTHEFVGDYIINSRTGKSTLISNYTKLRLLREW